MFKLSKHNLFILLLEYNGHEVAVETDEKTFHAMSMAKLLKRDDSVKQSILISDRREVSL